LLLQFNLGSLAFALLSAWGDSAAIEMTAQEQHITYPTDSKLAIKIIKRLNKRGKTYWYF